MLYVGYSVLVYTKGTESPLCFTTEEQQRIQEGKQLYQQKNCQACHQLYGLGGYLGPDLTTAYSDKNRGERFMRAMLKAGGNRMSNFHFSASEVDALIAYFKYVDATTASPYSNSITKKGWVSNKVALSFPGLSLSYLVLGLGFGVPGGFQYLLPPFFKLFMDSGLFILVGLATMSFGACQALHPKEPRPCLQEAEAV